MKAAVRVRLRKEVGEVGGRGVLLRSLVPGCAAEVTVNQGLCVFVSWGCCNKCNIDVQFNDFYFSHTSGVWKS